MNKIKDKEIQKLNYEIAGLHLEHEDLMQEAKDIISRYEVFTIALIALSLLHIVVEVYLG